MAKGASLAVLFEAESEPTPKAYKEAVDDTIKNPQQLSSLTKETVQDDVLILLTTRSNRLSLYFSQLRAIVRQNPKSSITSSVAAETVIFLVRMLPFLHQLLDPTEILRFLIPTLDICFVPIQRPSLRELALVLAEAGSLLEYVTSDRLGSDILRQWACTPNSLALDSRTLGAWTQTFVKMVATCRKSHDVTQAVQQWNSLKILKASLQSMNDIYIRQSKDDSGLMARQGLPSLGKMTQLSKEDKKARTAKRQNVKTSLPPLPDHLKDFLKAFGLQIPGSINALQDVIKQLEGEKTTAILLSIATCFPCNLCIMGLESSLENPDIEVDEQIIGAVSDLRIDTVDRKIGIWKPRSVSSLLGCVVLTLMIHIGLARPVTEKLRELASGDWVPQEEPKAAPRSQTKGIKVPLSSIQCGQNHCILWQIDIGLDEETNLSQQMIIVWEVCEKSDIAKIIDRVVFVQRSYSDETVNRCLEHCSTLDGKKIKQIPACFNDSSLSPAISAKRPAQHDIRTVDQDVIDMTNKIYALTEPVMRSILTSDLSAEFPFVISREEARVIGHFQTASLILGRSGTGKTTCLVYRLVRKYLASCAVIGEKAVRQVLLTRSSFLAEKLRSYARKLIETSSSKSLSLGLSQQREQALLMTGENDSGNESVLTLRDESFPRVYTGDHFLQVLENTTRIWHRQDFPELVGQVVDFYTFKVGYWPRFSHAITKDFSVNLVFAEIMGVIKGSASSAESLVPLQRKEYLMRSCRMAFTFATEVERSRVYDLFESYETLKISRGDMDYVDRVVRVLKAMRQDPSLTKILRSKFEEVYIDEIQDQRCLDIELLLSFIKDPHGFHFAGDTAQAISQDSTFRFSDINGMFFQHFAAVSVSTRQADLARPELFTLSKNYLSHQGILSLASFVMGMIWQGFPETVDKLEPEIGNLSGPRPLLLIGVDFGLLRSSNAGHTTYSVGTADFGAEQAILVRDTNTKIALQDHIGDAALVFTILDSKGMEFDDVILCHNKGVEVSLEKAEGNMSNEYLVGVVKLGVLHVLENGMKAVEELVVEAEQGMLETRKILDTVSCGCT